MKKYEQIRDLHDNELRLMTIDEDISNLNGIRQVTLKQIMRTLEMIMDIENLNDE